MADTTQRWWFSALAGGVATAGLGAAVGLWWGRRIPGHIFRDDDDWYVDEPALRELQRRIRWSGGSSTLGGFYFSMFGHGSIKLVPTTRVLAGQSGNLYAVESMLSAGQSLEFVMLDLVIHRVGILKLIHYTPRPVPGRLVQGPDVGPVDRPERVTPPDSRE